MGPWDPGIQDPEEVRRCRRFKAQRVNEATSRANEAASRANEAASNATEVASKDEEGSMKMCALYQKMLKPQVRKVGKS